MHTSLVVTGASGFIGRNVVELLSRSHAVIAVDRIRRPQEGHEVQAYLDAQELLQQSAEFWKKISHVVHLGASVDTGSSDRAGILENNFEYSKKLFALCAQYGVRFIYASSAATYGDGSQGFDDSRRDLHPQNPYAESKHLFDEFVRDASVRPPQAVGLKFFNVYGPHEGHKGRMASTVLFSYTQAKADGVIKLFRSLNLQYADGEQKRDFIYVRDIAKVIEFFINHNISGIYNLGSGEARTFMDLARAVFAALGVEPRIEFIDMPERFRKQYQYYTKADMSRLRAAGYTEPFVTLEEGVRDYVQQYLERGIGLA